MQPTPPHEEDSLTEKVTIPLIEEDIRISSERVVTGEVQIAKTVSLEEVELELTRSEHGYDIERRAVKRMHDTVPPAVRTEGDATIYSVVREVPVVVTRYEVIEEIVVRNRTTAVADHQTVFARKEQIDVRRKDMPAVKSNSNNHQL